MRVDAGLLPELKFSFDSLSSTESCVLVPRYALLN